MFPADLVTTLERLIGLGFSPFLALIIGFVIVLAGVIGSGFIFFWRAIGKERARQDKDRAARDDERNEWKLDIERRFSECEEDREELHQKVNDLDRTVTRISSCRKRDCPMRLPS